LNNISNILNQLQSLATQGATGTFSGSYTTLNNEFQTLVGEITRQASNVGLASGGSYNVSLSVYIGGGNTVANSEVTINLSGSANTVDATGLGLGSAKVDNASDAQSAISSITAAVAQLGVVQGVVGDGENDLTYAIGLANSQITNESAAESNIRDANIAQEASALTQQQVLQQSSVAALAQANSEPQALLKLLQ